MPNWCMNELEIMGTPDELKRFVEDSMGLPAVYTDPRGKKAARKLTTPYFCFNALVPTPDSVKEIGFDGHDKVPELNRQYAIRGETVYPIDGYYWNIANWGTKWDVYSYAITAEEMGWREGADSIRFEFDTAWSPPDKWLASVARLYPTLRFKLHYEEPGCFFAGDIFASEGVSTVAEYTDAQCEDLFSWIFEDADEQMTEAM